VRALGLFNPLIRELPEMDYQFEEPFVLDTTKYESTFGAVGTPLADAVASTVEWYRSLTDAPASLPLEPITRPAPAST
jgi:hypothetical protein